MATGRNRTGIDRGWAAGWYAVSFLLLAALVPVPAWAGKLDANRVIVRFNPPGDRVSPMSRAQVAARAASVDLEVVRPLSGGAWLLRARAGLSDARMAALSVAMGRQPDVLYAESDRVRLPARTPDDGQYGLQWHYYELLGGINRPAAWDETTGSTETVVAVVDSGVVPHRDMDSDLSDGLGRVVPGYDFISADMPGEFLTANDGDGRDPDPTDPGDWVQPGEAAGGGFFSGCTPGSSSWHGTHVAGTIGALTDNALGVSGVDWRARLLPVRVLGKCGGYVSDIGEAVRWAAGLPVPGVPDNPNPARVVNLSLGARGVCSRFEQEAIDDARAAGAVVVVAVGNGGAGAGSYSPANCAGVIRVAATERNGGLAYYSNRGPEVDIAAPGGLMDFAATDGILSLANTGRTAPVPSPGGDTYRYLDGTSAAAPLVSGVLALMFAAAPALSVDDAEALLLESAREFPGGTGATGGDCSPDRCGAGILDAGAAVAAAVEGRGKGGGGGGASGPIFLLLPAVYLGWLQASRWRRRRKAPRASPLTNPHP